MLDRPRVRLYRLFVYLAVSVLVLGTTEPSLGERLLLATLYLGMGLGGVALHGLASRGRPWRLHLWPLAVILDVAAQGFLIQRLGGSISPLLLLFGVPILIWGILRGIPGGLWAAGSAASTDVLLLAWSRDGVGTAQALSLLSFHIPALLLLGLFAGLLGRRIHQVEAQHRATRRELEQAQLDAESIVAHLSSGLLCLDDLGRLTRVNGAARRLLGEYGPVRPGSTLEDLRAAPGLAEMAGRLEGHLGIQGEATWELTLGRREAGDPEAEERAGGGPGSPVVPLEMTASPIPDPAGRPRGMVVFVQDLTGRITRERERARKERLALIGELSAGLAHEIRNSLKPITGSVELLKGEVRAGNPATDGLMEIILRESESLENFLTEFLNFARDKNLQIEPIPLERVIGEEFESLSLLPGRPFRLVIPRDGDAPLWVKVDAGALRQVIRNLGINALEAGGAPIEVGWERDGSAAVVFVRDHGPGIPEEIRDKVLDPFFTTKSHGTGLGLAIARDLVERHGGRLTLVPAEGGGTRAAVRLPLVPEVPERYENRPAAGDAARAA